MVPHDPAATSRAEPPAAANPNAMESNGSAGSHTAHGSTNGPASTAGGPAAEPKTGESDQVERAEEIVDRVAKKVSEVTSVWGRRVVRLFSRAKEEAEDIWGEAQSIRRGDQP